MKLHLVFAIAFHLVLADDSDDSCAAFIVFVQITFNKEAIDVLNDIFSILYKLIAFRICFSGNQ